MVTTRSKRAVVADSDAGINSGYNKARSSDSSRDKAADEEIEEDEEEEEEEDSESDSDAPEEEGISGGVDTFAKLEAEAAKLEQDQKKTVKQKRREQNLKFAQQQQEKKARIIGKQGKEVDITELPDILPEELLESIDNDSVSLHKTLPATQPKRINFQEPDKKQLKKLKLAKLKQLNKLNNSKTLKKGPVTVSVLNNGNNYTIGARRILSVPVGENRVVNKKNKWLQRKTLKKIV
ncbi:hypothetical protein PACTADRAFT_75772 [Pachysolen tannophilus NRRL Y-2460]|uniref:Uncharacterized protein n=1 Tax=Pachysolen tannophilus NRRL Y-2460 TaxID=669874 RepID=A0A1E4TU32_PACTA|nr:hypothetical protein PACTADRAFT_75772 [Pachysolen tannophilus NRRL Y-2460]